MKRVLLIGGLLLTAAAVTVWWLSARAGTPGASAVELSWRGSHRGEAVLPGQVAWCPVTRMGTLQAISNDTGLMVTLQESDSLVAAPHPVVAPGARDGAPRPSAIAALRWAGDSGVLLGFQSVSGLLELREVRGAVSGQLEMRMRAPVGFDTLVVRATFADLPVVAGAAACP